jgi:AraC-like DNA-binding protein
VDLWQVTFNPKTGRFRHTLGTDTGHSLVVWAIGSVFEALHVSAALHDGRFWWAIHDEPNVVLFEVEHGVETARWRYNDRHFASVRRLKKSLVGQHAGFSDFFVPVVKGGHVVATLVTGPFQTAYPTSRQVLERWRRMTGRHGDPADREFDAYLRATLSTLTLHGKQLSTYGDLLDCIAKLIASEGPAEALVNRAHVLRAALEPARMVVRTWLAAQKMLDARFSRSHYRAARAQELIELGLSRPPDQVLVALTVAHEPKVDPVGEAMRRDAFQRAAVQLARSSGDMIAGRVGDDGVVFLSAQRGSDQDKKRNMIALCRRAATMARERFGLQAYFGACLGTHSVPLYETYEAAVEAAESALSERTSLVFAGPGAPGARRHARLRALREELVRALDERPATLPARFEQYIELVAIGARQSIEWARTELEICFEHLSDRLLASGTLDPKSFRSLRETLDRESGAARALADLSAAYRNALSDLYETVRNPVPARQARSLRAALAYVRLHCGEPLGLAKVARMAGFAPKYFSRLFRQREKTTFAHYLARLRLERAKELLSGTELSATRVAELAGYRSPQYFCRVFRHETHETPLAYRQGLHPTRRIKGVKRDPP